MKYKLDLLESNLYFVNSNLYLVKYKLYFIVGSRLCKVCQ